MKKTLLHALVVLVLGCGTRAGGLDGGGPDLVGEVRAPQDLAGGDFVGLAWPDEAAYPEANLDMERWDPRFYRQSEVSLNGSWAFVFDPEGSGLQQGLQEPPFGHEKYPEEIQVPFPWQSVLSGVGPEPPDTWAKFGSEDKLNSYRGDVWYSTTIAVPPDLASAEHLVVRFGAVDWKATVWVEGTEVAAHEGGFTSFEVDVTPWAKQGTQGIGLAIRVTDLCDGEPASLLGKQGTTWYTCAGGIWQDVTLIRRPAVYVAEVLDRMDMDGSGKVKVEVQVGGLESQGAPVPGVRARMRFQCVEALCGKECGGVAEAAVEGGRGLFAVDLSAVPTWNPATPCLMTRVIELGGPDFYERTEGYFARRNLSVGWMPGHSPDDTSDVTQQYQGLFSAGVPIYLRAVLDQGYHPDGIFQNPSRSSRQSDIQSMKELGFNGIRQHIKPEAPWFYAMADALGMWVVYDFPAPATDAASGADAPWRPVFGQTMEQLAQRDLGHPSLLWWVLFNEAWGVANPPYWSTQEGQDYARGLYDRLKELDPGRPIEDHSPGGVSDFLSMGQFPHVESDLLSFNMYAWKVEDIETRLAAAMATFFPGSTTHLFGGRVQAGEPLFNSEFGGLAADETRGDGTYLLHSWLNQLHRYSRLQGYVFTQAYDVEWEKNGLLTYDRVPKQYGLTELGMTMADLTGDPYLVLGPRAIIEAAPGEGLSLELGLSTSVPMEVTGVQIQVLDSKGIAVATLELPGLTALGGYSALEAVELTAPTESGIYVVRALAETQGKPVRNGLYLVVDGGYEPQEGDVDVQAVLKEPGVTCAADGACFCAGWCDLSVVMPTPGQGRYRVIFEGEMASYDSAMPQTDDLLLMSSLEIRVDDEGVKGALVADCPADHRGVLSLVRHFEELRGLYGSWVSHDLGVVNLGSQVKITFRSYDNGVALFFRGGGRYLRPPRVRFEAEE